MYYEFHMCAEMHRPSCNTFQIVQSEQNDLTTFSWISPIYFTEGLNGSQVVIYVNRQKRGGRQEDGEKDGQDWTVIFRVILQ